MTLPYVDQHTVEVSAPPWDVWQTTLQRLRVRAAFGQRGVGAVAARLLQARHVDESSPDRGAGQSPRVGGFTVLASNPPHRLVLAGKHRFSRYAIEFRLAPTARASTALTIETRARFVGSVGQMYRALVIGTGVHAVAVRLVLLRKIRRRAERHRQRPRRR